MLKFAGFALLPSLAAIFFLSAIFPLFLPGLFPRDLLVAWHDFALALIEVTTDR